MDAASLSSSHFTRTSKVNMFIYIISGGSKIEEYTQEFASYIIFATYVYPVYTNIVQCGLYISNIVQCGL